jgi:hypothetical protein
MLNLNLEKNTLEVKNFRRKLKIESKHACSFEKRLKILLLFYTLSVCYDSQKTKQTNLTFLLWI